MKRYKRYWTFTEKQKRKAWRHWGYFTGMPLWYQQNQQYWLDKKSNSVDFYDENYVHPCRTGRGSAKWNWY